MSFVELVRADLDAIEEVTIRGDVARKNNVILEGKDVVDGFPCLFLPDVLNELTLVAGVTLEEVNLQQVFSLRGTVTLKLKTNVLANINDLTFSRVLDIKTEASLLIVGVVESRIVDIILGHGSVGVGVASGGHLEGGGGRSTVGTVLAVNHVGDPHTVVVKTSSTVGGNGVGDGSLGVQVVGTLPDVVNVLSLSVGNFVKLYYVSNGLVDCVMAYNTILYGVKTIHTSRPVIDLLCWLGTRAVGRKLKCQ